MWMRTTQEDKAKAFKSRSMFLQAPAARPTLRTIGILECSEKGLRSTAKKQRCFVGVVNEETETVWPPATYEPLNHLPNFHIAITTGADALASGRFD